MSLIPTIRKLWPGNAEPDGNSVRHINLGEEEFVPQLRRIIGNDPPAPPPRPAADPVVPQTLDQAGAALKVLNAAAKIVRDKMAQNPQLPRGEECFSDTRAKAIRNRRAQDVATALREAGEGLPLSILECGDLWRMHCALQAFDSFREEHGACEVQGKIVSDLRAAKLLADYNEALPELHRLDVAFVKTLLKARDLWQQRVGMAEKLRRPPHTPPHPELRMIGDQVALLIRQLRAVTPEDLL